jgi:hypothetical protein
MINDTTAMPTRTRLIFLLRAGIVDHAGQLGHVTPDAEFGPRHEPELNDMRGRLDECLLSEQAFLFGDLASLCVRSMVTHRDWRRPGPGAAVGLRERDGRLLPVARAGGGAHRGRAACRAEGSVMGQSGPVRSDRSQQTAHAGCRAEAGSACRVVVAGQADPLVPMTAAAHWGCRRIRAHEPCRWRTKGLCCRWPRALTRCPCLGAA